MLPLVDNDRIADDHLDQWKMSTRHIVTSFSSTSSILFTSTHCTSLVLEEIFVFAATTQNVRTHACVYLAHRDRSAKGFTVSIIFCLSFDAPTHPSARVASQQEQHIRAHNAAKRYCSWLQHTFEAFRTCLCVCVCVKSLRVLNARYAHLATREPNIRMHLMGFVMRALGRRTRFSIRS